MINLVRWFALFISSTAFSGFLPGKLLGKPGKGGGFAGAFVALIVQFTLLDSAWYIPPLIAVISLIVGMIVVGPAEALMLTRWGSRRRHTGEEVQNDFNETNIDEFHGQFVAGLPVWLMAGSTTQRIIALLVAFIAFRVFDTRKPWPIGQIERALHDTASGIMLDDTAAGFAAALVTAFVFLF